jgi:hypothetical protein
MYEEHDARLALGFMLLYKYKAHRIGNGDGVYMAEELIQLHANKLSILT